MSPRKPSSGWNWLRLLLGLVLALPLAAARAAPGGDEYYLNLPAVFKPPPGIFGRMTYHGLPFGAFALTLHLFNGSTYDSIDVAFPSADGQYRFEDVPSLGPGQRYYVRWLNPGDDNLLAAWFTRELTAYNHGDSVNIGDFDVANIPLGAPPPGAVLTLPNLFTWGFRPATPYDSFEFNLLDPQDGNPWFWTDPPLGHVNEYGLHFLPAGFETHTWYGWYVAVHSPDGGYGVSYYFRWINFSGAPLGGIEAHMGTGVLAGSEALAAIVAAREAGGK
jgi:hypothetical protein